jgi:GTP-binding protein LepA
MAIATARHGCRAEPAPRTLRVAQPLITSNAVADQAHIRNFSIIAHIDHGKSTLADRILELTHTVDPRAMRAQVLDSMELERERGITIKAQAVRVFYEAGDGQTYQLHLIDTPGHVDFTYEVSRSLAACEGALLVVDASQGVEAQTVANTYLAVDSGLELIPCLNKVDLPGAEPERVAEEVAELLGEPADTVRRISAKTGEGVTDVLDELIARVPPPSGDPDAPARALIFDSEFDQYRGVIAYIRVVDGTFTKGEAIRAMQAGTEAEIDDIGFFTPQMTSAKELRAGEVGFLITGIKDVTRLRVGDTLTTKVRPATEPLPGYREVKPMVFCGLFPIDSDDYPDLRDALEKLSLNDAALSWEPETSDALGFGFRCGFLGLLHMDIVRERLEREYDLELLATMPSVEYEVELTDGATIAVHSPNDMPDPSRVAVVREPYIRASILTPKEFIGQIMELCQERRGDHSGLHYLSSERVQLTYDLPLAEIVLDFFDQLKSRTRGYASLDYDLIGLRESDLVKLDILLAGDPVDALSMLVHKSKAYDAGRTLAERLRKTIPRQQYDVPIQAAVGSRIVARETIKAYRKDVTAKCYGGDITRKRKLLEQQKRGKQRMKQVGRIEVPQEAFLAVLELGEKS